MTLLHLDHYSRLVFATRFQVSIDCNVLEGFFPLPLSMQNFYIGTGHKILDPNKYQPIYLFFISYWTFDPHYFPIQGVLSSLLHELKFKAQFCKWAHHQRSALEIRQFAPSKCLTNSKASSISSSIEQHCLPYYIGE